MQQIIFQRMISSGTLEMPGRVVPLRPLRYFSG
jgi:hypothetical protein